MMRVKYFIMLIVIFLIPKTINADEIYTCDYKQRARHNSIALNIVFNLDFIEENNAVEFVVTISNLHPEIKIVDVVNAKTYKYNSIDETPKEIRLSGYKDGVTIRYELHSKDVICPSNLLFNKFINIPSYNKYYNDPICNDVKEFVLCKKWVKNNRNYEQFKTEVNNYKKKIIEEKQKEEDINKTNNQFIQFLINNYVYILISVIMIGSVSVFIISKSKKEFRF